MKTIVTSRPHVLAAVLVLALAAAIAASTSQGATGNLAVSGSSADEGEMESDHRQGEAGRLRDDLLGAGADDARGCSVKFKAKYGIDVKVNRQVDSVMVQQITAEQGSGKPVADLWVQASKNYTLGAVKNKWVSPRDRPRLLCQGV